MGIVRQIRNVTGGYSSSQVKVRDATANDDSRPPRHLLQEIADLSYDNHEVMLIMDMIDKRLNDKGKYWRHIFKSLILLDYLVHVGSDRVIMWCRENLYIVKTLREFNYRDDSGHEVGASIRERAKTLTSLIMDVERLERERARFARGGANRRPKRYRARGSLDDEEGGNTNGGADDDDLQRALELSKQTAAQEEERRRMAGRTADDDDFQRAMATSQQNQADIQAANQFGYGYDPYLQQQQQQQEAALAQAQAEYLATQQQAEQEAQVLYNMQKAQAEAEMRAAQEAYQNQVMSEQQQQQQQQSSTPSLQPLKTGSNNPFAAFNQSQQSQAEPAASKPTSSQLSSAQSAPSLSRRPSMHRQSTFDQDHMDRLDKILSLEAPMDTFGNTGSSKIPAQHTENTGFVDSSGRGLTAMLTARQKTSQESNNPFAQGGAHYTGIASTQMQPAHTGYGFGNANHSSTNLIDL